MRSILVAGKSGQLARSLVDVGVQRTIPVVAVSRPEFDLENAGSIDRVVKAVLPRAIINGFRLSMFRPIMFLMAARRPPIAKMMIHVRLGLMVSPNWKAKKPYWMRILTRSCFVLRGFTAHTARIS